MSKVKTKLAYKPVGMLAGAAAGLIAGVLVKQVWRLAAGESDTPDALDEQRLPGRGIRKGEITRQDRNPVGLRRRGAARGSARQQRAGHQQQHSDRPHRQNSSLM